MPARTLRFPRLLPGLAAAGVVCAYAVAAVAVPRAGTPPTTDAAVSGVAHTGDLAAGLGLLAAGLVAAAEPSRRRVGLLAILAGIAWFGPDWEGWSHGGSLVRSLGALGPLVFLALVVHLVLSAPTGRLRSRLERGAVAAAYAVAGAAVAGRALFRDPFLDPYCWRNCVDNSFLVHSGPRSTRAADDLWLGATLAVGLLLALLAALRLVASSGPARRLAWPEVATGASVGAAAAAYAAALWHRPLEDPRAPLFSSIFIALALSTAVLALGVGWNVARVRRIRASVARLAGELRVAPEPGGLRDAVAEALGDPGLEVLYRLPGARAFVDAAGREARVPLPDSGRAVTPIVRDGRPIAAVVHDAALVDVPDLGREIGSAASLAVENERLRVELLARVDAVRSSRARIVETADEERRRLERNLHDGAQQRLLALSYQLRMAEADAAAGGGDPALAALLASSGAEAQAALDELRRLAHGIFPAILTEAGLGPALASLADTAPVPVELVGAPPGRYPAAVETAAYVAVADAVDEAAARRATFVDVEVREEHGTLVLVIRDDGEERGAPPVHVGDRVGALGGIVVEDGAHMCVEIPCA